MAIGVMNFPDWNDTSNISTPLANIINSGMNTYKGLTGLQQGNVDVESKQFANQMAAAKAKYAPEFATAELQEAQAKPALTKAQATYQEALASGVPSEIAERMAHATLEKAQSKEAEFYSKNPLLKLPGPAGQLGALAYMQSNPAQFGNVERKQQSNTAPAVSDNSDGLNYTPIGNKGTLPVNIGNQPNATPAPSSYSDLLLHSLTSGLNKNIADSDYTQKRANSFAYSTAPVEAKSYMLAQLAGAGVNPDEAVNALATGKTVNDILKEKGFDPSNPPEPDYLPTKGNVTSLKNRQAALKEVQVIGDFIRQGLGPYSQTFMRMSPAQVKDALTGENKQQQIDFLAARGLAPEQANLRLTLANAKATVSAQKEMMKNSMLEIEPLRSLVSSEVWNAAQKRMDDKLTEAFSKARQSYFPNQNNNVNAAESKENRNSLNSNEKITKYIRRDGKLIQVFS